MTNKTILMSDALHFSAEQAINPYYYDSTTSPEAAQAEHDAIAAYFRKAGIHVVHTPSPADSQDGVYTANWALVRGDKAVMARLPNVRKTEEAYARDVLTKLGKTIIDVPDDLHFSGQGDALACGDYLFCGQGYRSDEAAQKFAAETLGYTRIQLRTVPLLDAAGHPVTNAISGWADSLFYDIDLALAVLRHPSNDTKGLIAYCPDAFTPESRQIIEGLDFVDTLQVSFEEASEAFALNLVSTGDTIIMSSKAPAFTHRLESLGFAVLTPSIEELSKGGGYIRCTSLTLD